MNTSAAVSFASRETYAVGGCVFPNQMIFHYDTTRWDFRSLVAKVFDTDDLEHLHLNAAFNPLTRDDPAPNYEATKNSWAASKALKEAVSAAAEPIFRDLLHGLVADIFHPIASFQPRAAARVNFHGAKAILRFHTDAEYGQDLEAVNLWLPVTSAFGSNSMYLESAVGRGDYTPLRLTYGQACLFHGGQLMHGTQDNDSGSTRISFDLRFRIASPTA